MKVCGVIKPKGKSDRQKNKNRGDKACVEQFSAVKHRREDDGENKRAAGHYVFLMDDSHDEGGYQRRDDYGCVFLFTADAGIVHYHSGNEMRCHIQHDGNDNAIPKVMIVY